MKDNSVKIGFIPRNPLIWMAEYPDFLKEIKIPFCKNCNSLIKVSDYDNIKCDACNSENFTWDSSDGALIVNLNNGFILEFDERGIENIPFKYLPVAEMMSFSLLDPITDTRYSINLNSGRIFLSNLYSSEKIAEVGIGVEDNNFLSGYIELTNILERYAKDKTSLIHGKRCSSTACGSNLMNIYIGYEAEINNKTLRTIIRVDCNTHVPSFCIRYE